MDQPSVNYRLNYVFSLRIIFGTLYFMVALSAALVINYPKPKDQIAIINHHAPQALSMVAIILAAGAF